MTSPSFSTPDRSAADAKPPGRPGRTWLGWSVAYVAIVLLTATFMAVVQASPDQKPTSIATRPQAVARSKGHRTTTAPKAPPARTGFETTARTRPRATFSNAFVASLPSSAVIWAILFLTGASLAVTSKFASAANQRRQAAADAAAIERQHQIEAFMNAPLTPIAPGKLVLQPGESCYWQEPAQLMELRTHTHYEGGSLGLSVRIARGLYLRPGAFRGAPVSNTAMEIDDAGTVFVTNTRIVFIGGGGAKTVTLKQLAGLEPFSDGVRITPSNKKPLALITGNYRLGVVIDRTVHGALATSIPAATQPETVVSADVSLPGGAGPLLQAALRHIDRGRRQGNAITFPAREAIPDHPVMTLYTTSGRTIPDGRTLVGMKFAVDEKDAAAFEQEAIAWVTSANGGQQAFDAWRASASVSMTDFVAREPSGEFSVFIPVDAAKAGLGLFGAAPQDHAN